MCSFARRWPAGPTILVLLLIGPSTGLGSEFSFGPASSYAVSSVPNGVAVGDLNNDGYDDAVVVHRDSGLAAVLLSEGASGFLPATYVTVGGPFNMPTTVSLGDFDEDGDLDMAVGKTNVDNLAILLGDGEGGFPTLERYSLPNAWPQSLATADVNDDAHVDLVFADRGTGMVGVLLGTGTGAFPDLRRFPAAAADDPLPGFSEPTSVATGDFNGDGQLDVAVSFGPRNYFSVLLGDGTGNFGSPAVHVLSNPMQISEVTRIAAIDDNADGKLDLAISQQVTGRVVIFRGDGSAGFEQAAAYWGRSPIGNVISRDFNLDQSPDFATVMPGTPGAVVLVPGPASMQRDPEAFALVGNSSYNFVFVESGDFDGDGAPDLIAVSQAAGSVSRLLNGFYAPPPSGNQPPTAAIDAYSVAEGTTTTINGTASDPDPGEALLYIWSYAAGDSVDEGATCAFFATNTTTPKVVCTDDGTYTLSFTVSDGKASTTASNTLTVNNVVPTLDLYAPPDGALFATGTTVSADGNFSDPSGNDTFTCMVNWGDGAISSNGECTTMTGMHESHQFDSADVYTIKATVTDDDSGDADATKMVVVYDPSGGYVSGEGWIQSPLGAYKPDPAMTGKASFGFVSKYRKGATVPDGNAVFVFQAGDLNFHSSAYDWLVVSGISRAQFKGTGTINGFGSYGFMVSVTDAGTASGNAVNDTFRIKIWNKSQGDEVVYDNAVEQAIGGGNIVIHTVSKK